MKVFSQRVQEHLSHEGVLPQDGVPHPFGHEFKDGRVVPAG